MVIAVYFHIRELCHQEAPHVPKAHSDACCVEDMFGQIELAEEASTPDNYLAIKQTRFSSFMYIPSPNI